MHVPPPGENIPVGIEPFPVNNSAPQWYDIEWGSRRLQQHRLGGISRVQAEHLQKRLAAEKWEREPDTGHWYWVFELVHTAFRDVTFPKNAPGRCL